MEFIVNLFIVVYGKIWKNLKKYYKKRVIYWIVYNLMISFLDVIMVAVLIFYLLLFVNYIKMYIDRNVVITALDIRPKMFRKYEEHRNNNEEYYDNV